MGCGGLSTTAAAFLGAQGQFVIRLFKHYVPVPVLLLGLVELVLLFLSAELAWEFRAAQIGSTGTSVDTRLGELLTYSGIVLVSLLAVGAYQRDGYRSARLTATRLTAAFVLAFVALSVVFYLFPNVALWRSISLYAMLFSFLALLIARTLFNRIVGWQRFRRCVLVLGAGCRAAQIAALAASRDASFAVAGYIRMSDKEAQVADAVPYDGAGSLRDLVETHRVDEIVLAIEERRGALPLDDLLQAKLSGVYVSDLSSFLERETGRIDLASASPSWLILSDGFLAAGPAAVAGKRLFDIVASALLLILSSPVLLVTAILIKLTSPGPVFYRQERVGQYGRPFDVIKFRSMRVDAEKDGKPQWAQERDPRVTALGRFIRATRIDEIPQIFCVLRGNMSFVGPRPERPFFVKELAAQLPFYNERHVVKPGITGWAQLNYPYGASVEDARHKLEYDLYYVKNYSSFLDLLILIQTVRVVLWRDGVR